MQLDSEICSIFILCNFHVPLVIQVPAELKQRAPEIPQEFLASRLSVPSICVHSRLPPSVNLL